MFFTANDNSGSIRINYVTDETIAAAMNKAGRLLSVSGNLVPAVSSPSLMGGYCYPILEDIAQGRTFQILKSSADSSPVAVKRLKALAAAPETLYSYVDQGEITIVQIEEHDRREFPLSSFGWDIENTPKTFKRLKTLNRPFRLWDRLTDADGNPRELRVAIMDDDAYISDEFEADGYSSAEIERLLDGAVVINPQLFLNCKANIHFPVFAGESSHEHPEMFIEKFRRQEFLRQAQHFKTFNGRIFGAMHFTGLDPDDVLHERSGLIKAEFFCDVAGTCERLGVDVIAARSALKTEVSYSGQPFILIEPQKAKKSGVNSDIQTMSNLPGLYKVDAIQAWVDDFLAAKFDDLKNNKLMPEWFDMSSTKFNGSTHTLMPNDVDTLNKWNARVWMLSGRKITESPWLFEQLASSIAKSVNTRDDRRLRFPVPCAVRAQVISASMSSMAGFDADVYQGCARWVEELEAVVVNDEDWLEMYRSHGGMDLDDFFTCYYRTIGNCRKIVTVRSPNDWGEYSIFDYVEGDWFPTFTKADGTIIQFPEADNNPELWAERLSEVYSEGRIEYRGLPTENSNPTSVEQAYGINTIVKLIQDNKGSAACVGANVNARTLHSVVMRSHRPVQLCPMEGAIDAGTQGGSAEDTIAVQEEATEILKAVIASGRPICAYLWRTRFVRANQVPFPQSRLTTETHLFKADQIRKASSRRFLAMARDYAQKNLTQVDICVHRLGRRMLPKALEVLVTTRRTMVSMQDVGSQTMGLGDWYDVHSLPIQVMNSFDTVTDQYDFVLALYSACFKLPTRSTGKVSDQIVMNPHLFPYLMDALRYYGLANHVEVDENNQIVSWKQDNWILTCETCGDERETDNPVLLQSYNAQNRVCGHCRQTAQVEQ